MKAYMTSLLAFFASFTQLPAKAASGLKLDLEKSIHAGAGCVAADSDRPLLVYQNGLLRVQATGLGLLLGLGSSELAGRANCTVRIPYEIPEGQYIKSIQSRLVYGVYKTEAARGAVTARVSAADIASQTQVVFEQGAAQDEYFLIKPFLGSSNSLEQACRASKGLLKVDLASSGQLSSADDKLIIESIMGEVKIYARFELASCAEIQ